MRVGVFRCPPADVLWTQTNDNIGERPHVVFPSVPVGLERSGGVRVLATPADIVFYRPHETYRRLLRDARGDVSLFVAPEPEHLDVPGAPIGHADAATFLLARRLLRALRDAAEPLVVEELAVRLLDRATARKVPGTNLALAEAAKELLVARLEQPLSLGALAADLHVSPFHLTRVFRAHTGRTLTAYLHDLRLRDAVERIEADCGGSLSRLAADLGYCSPSHFTDRFRAVFGMPPSQLRNFMEAAVAARA